MRNLRTLNQGIEFYQNHKQLRFSKRPLQDQYDRALLSIVLNLSEGAAKTSNKERHRFYRISLGSLREVQTLLLLDKKLKAHASSDPLAASLYCLCRSVRN